MSTRTRFTGLPRVVALSLALAVPAVAAAMQGAWAQTAAPDEW